MLIKHVLNATVEDDEATVHIFGQHKTGYSCTKTLPLDIYTELKEFCERGMKEQNMEHETPVGNLFTL